MPALVLLNPAAGGGRAARRRPALEAALRRAGLDAEVVETTGPGHAEDAARRAADADLVVAAGGDGTVREVVNGLAAHGPAGPALGVVPLGTGDDYARALGVPRDLDAAARALASTPPVPVDVGVATWADDAGDHAVRFANCLGVGFDAEAAALARETKWLGGRAAYLAAVARTLWTRRPRPARVSVDGVVLFDGPLFLCEVGNGPAIGGGIVLNPGAVLDDGALDVCLACDMSPARAAVILPQALRGAHVGAPEVAVGRGVRVEVEAAGPPLAVQADGDVLTFSARRVRADVVPGALRAVAPALAGGAAGARSAVRAVAEGGYDP